jgi:microsomal epoxide hydrolase
VSSGEALQPFRLAVPDAVLADLEGRLANIRWPTPAPGPAWRWGTDQTYLRALIDHWRNRFNWRHWEARLNRHANHIATINGVDVHFLIEQGSGPAPLPIILSHGWPGSVFELIGLVEPLAHPERFGGDASDGFTVVVPSLPGFGFAPAPPRILSPQDVALLWHRLMGDVLGFPRYVAHGGDTGATVTSWMGMTRHPSLAAIHLSNAVLQPLGDLAAIPPDAEEAAFIERQTSRIRGEEAYQHLHAEKPETLAYALTDSPVALAAWIVEKMHGWTDRADAGLSAIGMDAILADVTAYWIGGSLPLHWMYQTLRDMSAYALAAGQRVETPTGFCLFPNDIALPPPRKWLDRAYNVASLFVADAGGHFPGLECPDLLATDIRTFFAAYR